MQPRTHVKKKRNETIQACFRENVPEAIERGCYEMDTSCLETQFRALGRQCQCHCQNQPNTDVNSASPSSQLGAAGARELQREAGDAAEVSSRMIACGGDCGGNLESHSPRGGGAVEGGGGEPQFSGEASNVSSDARSRLSGAATGMVGGATAVVAIATKVGEVRRVWV